MRETGFYKVWADKGSNHIVAFWSDETARWSKILCLSHFQDSDFYKIGERV